MSLLFLTSAIGGAVFSLPAQATTISADDVDPSGSITINATSSGSAAAGTIRGSPSSPAAVARENAHAMEYDGPTQFTANWDITLNPQNMFVSGTVTFVTNSYTAPNRSPPPATETKPSTFTTQAITITGATVNPQGQITSFTFDSTNWYSTQPKYATGAITSDGLSGMINLLTGASSYTAKYIIKSNGVVDTYTVTSPPKTPLPPAWTMLLAGFAGIALVVYRPKKTSSRKFAARIMDNLAGWLGGQFRRGLRVSCSTN
jgi:hypothetical protein